MNKLLATFKALALSSSGKIAASCLPSDDVANMAMPSVTTIVIAANTWILATQDGYVYADSGSVNTDVQTDVAVATDSVGSNVVYGMGQQGTFASILCPVKKGLYYRARANATLFIPAEGAL